MADTVRRVDYYYYVTVHDTPAKASGSSLRSVNVTAASTTGAGSARYGMIVWVDTADYDRAAHALGA